MTVTDIPSWVEVSKSGLRSLVAFDSKVSLSGALVMTRMRRGHSPESVWLQIDNASVLKFYPRGKKMNPAQLQSKVAEALRSRGQAMRRATSSIRILLVTFGAFVAGIAQFISWPKGQDPTAAQIIGMAATLIVFVGALILSTIEEDAGEQLALAHQALDAARESEQKLASSRAIYGVVDRMIGLYQATGTLRSTLEQASVGFVGDESIVVERMLALAARSLVIGAGFAQADQWTIGVYIAEPDAVAGKSCLRCIAHRRAIECDLSSSRKWPEGVGVAGIAFSNRREVIVEDLSDNSILSVFQPTGLVRDYDDDRYRSMVAVPVSIQADASPWGVVCATSDRVGHFNHDAAPGLKHEEAIRALAGYVALAVVLARSRGSGRSIVTTPPPSPPRPQGGAFAGGRTERFVGRPVGQPRFTKRD